MKISPCELHVNIPVWTWSTGHSENRLVCLDPYWWVDCWLIGVVCASRHKRTRQEFWGQMCTLTEAIWMPLLPFSQQWWQWGMCCAVSSRPIQFIYPWPHLLALKTKAPMQDSRLQEAKESSIVQIKSEIKDRVSHNSVFTCHSVSPCYTFYGKIRPRLCPSVFSVYVVRGSRLGCSAVPIFAPSTTA